MNAFWFVNQLSICVELFIHLLMFIPILIGFRLETYSSKDDLSTIDQIKDEIKKQYLISSLLIHQAGKKPMPTGIVLGKWLQFLAFVKTKDSEQWNASKDYEIFIITLWYNCFSKKLSSSIDEKSNKDEDRVVNKKLINSSAHLSSGWDEKPYILFDKPTKNQYDICQRIINNCCNSKANGCPFGIVVLLSGKPGLGKSMIVEFLSHMLNGLYCNSFIPTREGQHLEEILKRGNPTEEKPFIFEFPEFDKIMDITRHDVEKEKPKNQWYYPNIFDKASYNRFFDRLDKLENVITVLTTNLSIKDLESKYDPALTRFGRIHLKISLNEIGYIETRNFSKMENIAEKSNRNRFNDNEKSLNIYKKRIQNDFTEFFE